MNCCFHVRKMFFFLVEYMFFKENYNIFFIKCWKLLVIVSRIKYFVFFLCLCKEVFSEMIYDAGFTNVMFENLTFGVVSIHDGFKI